ncbi:potassium transporter Trk [Bordetella genomosp. 1]|uniref:Trk system potassium uptake protein n=1 Tax=Bordetella genomosp. 1 TaxID=1395607 RepID=A0A261RSM7_9BORD|nr:potassium transporter TrkG [Bordetella genomosp. 1]OZI28029.1 potassium transporter Trk [Bordetella genomosp. 1]OZI68129.1 potassium transporter Trk [Bordetella genomosp. 1]
MKRLLATFYVLGLTMVVFALTMLIPLGLAWFGGDDGFTAFLEGFLIALGIGGGVWLLTHRWRRELHARDGFLLVTTVWAGLPLLAALPLLLYFHGAGQPLSFTDAYFEAMSGLTTTGATVLTGLDHLPRSINLWRATLIWIGGMGILVLAVAILPLLGVGGHQVVRAEQPGPMKDERLTPRIAGTAKALYAVYFGFSILCLLSYRAVGLSWFDAWCHMATTMGLGGFSTYDDGFLHFDSVAVEMVAIVFMLISGINFATHFNALRSRSLRPYLDCPQTIPYLVLVLGAGLTISLFLLLKHVYTDPLTALRYGMFNTISVATTTGYANVDYTAWPLFAPLTMLLLSAFATSAGSTGGGIKMIRVMLLIKQARNELVTMLHPHAVSPVRIGQRIVDSRVMSSVLAFMLVYGLSVGVLSSLLLLSGMDLTLAFSVVMAMINNTGPALGALGPMGNFGSLTDFQTWVCTFGMLIGRLELLTVLVLFTPWFWRK